MSNEIIKKGSTSQIIEVMLRSATTGQPLTGIAFGSVTIKEHRQGATPTTRVAVTMTAGTWASIGWVETSDTGVYQFGVPNAGIATGAESVTYTFTATGAITAKAKIILTDVDLKDATRGGMSALPNVAAAAVGGLPIRDANGNIASNVVQWNDEAVTDLESGNLTVKVMAFDTNAITANAINAGALNGKGDWNINKTGYSLTAAEKTAIAVSVAQDILNDADGTAVMQGIANVIADDWVAGDASPLAIATAIRNNLATELARIDATISSRAAPGAAMTISGTIQNLDDLNTAQNTQHATTRTQVSAIQTVLNGITSLASWLGTLFGKSADASTLTEIQATTGGATFDNTTDSPEAIRDRGDSAWTTGSGGGGGLTGPNTVTITVQDDSDNSPIENARVRLSKSGSSGSLDTNASGQVSFSAESATWTVDIYHSSFDLFTTATLVVSGNTSQTYQLTDLTITPSTDPAETTAYMKLHDKNRDPLVGEDIEWHIVEAPEGFGHWYDNGVVTTTSNASGIVQLPKAPKGATFDIRGDNESFRYTIPTDAGATHEVKNEVF